MRPPPAPGPKNSIPIEDPQLMTRIQRAMTVLGKSSVTHSELSALVAKGTL